MTLVGRFEGGLGPGFHVLSDRVRAHFWRIRGARLGSKVRIGSGCRILRPWCVTAGERAQFEHGVFVKVTEDGALLSFGDQVFVGCGTEFDVSRRVIIGANVLIAPGCFITDHSHRHSAVATIASQGCESAPVTIGDDVWLGAHAIVLAGVTIGNGAIIAANSVVNSDIDTMTIVAGSPARVVGVRT